jgi:hypothetical protein
MVKATPLAITQQCYTSFRVQFQYTLQHFMLLMAL